MDEVPGTGHMPPADPGKFISYIRAAETDRFEHQTLAFE